MKKVFTVLVCGGILAACMSSASNGYQTFSESTQASSASAPTSASFTVQSGSTAGAALSLDLVNGFRVSVCAVDTGTALGASGTLQAWLYDSRSDLVMRNNDLDWTIDSATRCQVFPDQKVEGPFDRVLYTTSAVLVQDAGTLLPDAGTGAFIVRMRGWKTP